MGTINEDNLIHRHNKSTKSSTSTSIVAAAAAEVRLDQEDMTMSTLHRNLAKNALTNGHLTHEQELQKLREIGTKTPILPSQIGTDFSFKRQIVWPNAIGFLMLHICAAIGCLLPIFNITDVRTTAYSIFLVFGSGLGVTMGAHRLWSHRAFKATKSLKLLLLWLHTLAGQNCLYVWVRDHRQHHKYSDTDADPHNASRGFFFSHIGWLMSKKHPKVFEYGKKIDMTDIEADPYIMFQKRHYKVLYTIFALYLPTAIPIYFWNENPICAMFTAFFARTVIQLNFTWLVNSAAHLYGTRPFDKTIFPVESMFVALCSVGEGWHNYHHAFPWDYRASELGTPLNITGFLIDILAKHGFVYDRKEATHNMVKNRVLRHGDGSHKVYGDERGRNAFTTLFNMWKHPLNPTYTSIYPAKPKTITGGGYALAQHELAKNEVDDEILSKENATLEKQKEIEKISDQTNIKKFIVDKIDAPTMIDRRINCDILHKTDDQLMSNSNNLLIDSEWNNNNNNNNNNSSSIVVNGGHMTKSGSRKSDLNIDATSSEHLLVK